MIEVYNIALVGHVANGKTTLVNALTGVNTKRSSSEIKSGRTIKLGYANCIMWRCDSCQTVSSSSQDVKELYCDNCTLKSSMKIVKKISFVDAPGHHDYVHTMIKGATVVDAAILVTDVRREALQIQTLEHLAILSVLNVKNIIVVQNKADLVSGEQCIKHYNELKQSLIGTVAEESIIVPVSAQNDINIDVLRLCLMKLVEGMDERMRISLDKVSAFTCGLFNIVRSFDINKPGIDYLLMKGGIVGGTVVGDVKFCIGDTVEIRPGILKKDGTCLPLTTKIESIFSEKDKCSETVTGGLFGIGTTLDPLLTASDRLSGSLLGIPGTMPDIVYELEMKITTIKLDDTCHKEKVKIGTVYRLVIGNVSVNAVAKESKTVKCVIMKFNKPICTKESRCLIYTQESSNTRMIAFGAIISNEIYKRDIPVIHIKQPNYDAMIKNISFIEKAKNKIPVVRVVRENRNIMWINIQQVADAIHRPICIVYKHIQEETLYNVSMSQGGLRIYKSNISGPKIESILRRFIKTDVMCKQCQSLNTDMIKCLECGANDYSAKIV